MDPNQLDPAKALEIQRAFEAGGLLGVYLLGKADSYLVATEQLIRITRLAEARSQAMDVVVTEYTDAMHALHAVKSWVAENLPEVDMDLWEILMSIDTSDVEA